EYVEEFFKKAIVKAGGKFRTLKEGFIALDSVPYEVRRIAERTEFKNRYGRVMKSYPKITFDKEVAFRNPDAEFVSFGHPLLEALIEWVHERYLPCLQRGALFKDPSGTYDGLVWFFEGEVRDGKGEVAGKCLVAIYDNGKEVKEVNPAFVWDLVPVEPQKIPDLKIEKERATRYAVEIIERYKQDILEERKRQAQIKRKYGVQSLNYLIEKLDTELVELYERQGRGEKVELPIYNKEERKRKYEEALGDLEKEIERELNLTISMPKLLGAILVKPEASEMVSDSEVERIGMEIAMKYERAQGRVPEDVSSENLGFDIRSRGDGEVRYIEVKARRDEGPVALTPNEWFKAKRFKEQYWLYIVSNAVTKPTLQIINNPSENLEAMEKVEVVRFIIPPGEWKKKATEVRIHE
ncbi:MAG: DUF3883 domain-containing protein, partial [Candidatus Hadarchaeales archaeon]